MYREDGRPLHEGSGRPEDEGCDVTGRGSGELGELGTAEGLSDSTLDGGEDSGKSIDIANGTKRYNLARFQMIFKDGIPFTMWFFIKNKNEYCEEKSYADRIHIL
jgi:hypothetical protein